ncbi:MAG: radical SAM family heme chaperone HemW [Akkermansiaceae bacterium]
MLLYLHIPFCHRICPYCSFYKHTPSGTPIGEFIKALGEEAKTRFAQTKARPRTLYLGGGTPSMLSNKHLAELFESLKTSFDFSSLEEVTLEANPATFDLKKAQLLKEIGVSRVSLGIQSFSPHVLKTLGREHSQEEASRSVQILREADIPSINIDLMFSIPGQSRSDWDKTLHHTISLKPNHVSAYNLTYEEDTAFFESLKSGLYQESEDDDAEHYHLAERTLVEAGFEHYETSNYAQPNQHSSHNQGYWQGEDYLGLGPSAVSTIAGVRQKNIPDTAAYIRQIQSLGHATCEIETLSPEQRRIELIALGLRTTKGISRNLIKPESLEKIDALSSEGLLQVDESNIRLTKIGRPLVDPIAAELI